AQYFWLGTDVFTPSISEGRPLGARRFGATVRYFLTEYSTVGLDLVGSDGHERVVLQRPAWTPAGAGGPPLRVDTPRDPALPSAPGGWRPRVTATPLYSSGKILQVQKLSQPLRLVATAAAP